MTDKEQPEKNKPQHKSKKKWLLENIISFGSALLIVFMIRSSVIEAFKIPSGSMIPTLLIGDHIFVNKFAYGLKVPFSDFFASRPTLILRRDPPKRGDIIVFKFPKDEDIYYIKRVVGVPGDTVEIRNKVLYINQTEIKRDPVNADQSEKVFKDLDEPRFSSDNLELFTEHLNTADHPIMLDRNSILSENHGPIQVPPDNLFVMGDNRDYSNDSRFWGYVPMKNVRGKALVIWLSVWLNFSEKQFSFKPSRIGTVLK
ncbi:MAG: signal peptidase I [Bdellovibrionota bacterium]